MMGGSRKCNLELRLLPFTEDSDDHQHTEEEFSSRSRHGVDHHQQSQQQEKLTIVYNGSVCVCDVTELQGRAIISLATREMEETVKIPTSSSTTKPLLSSSDQQYCNTPSNLSMKRSLQRFLQKRRNRIQSTSPYIVN